MVMANRVEAGRRLADKLTPYRAQDVVVLGLPRGGVPVASEVARAIGAPLDVLVARKLGAPGNPELAIGAVTAGGTRVLHERALRVMMLPPGYLEKETETQRRAAAERERALRGLRPAVPLAGKTVILVDDGIATGMTMRAAVEDVLAQGPVQVVVAAPVVAPDTGRALARLVDAVVALDAPDPFYAVGQFYEDFSQTTDDEVKAYLREQTRT